MSETSPLGAEDPYPPTVEAARRRIRAVRPDAYARTRNALDGEVTRLSPYITHGFVSMVDVLADVSARHELTVRHKLVFELGWRAYFRHVWRHRGAAIEQSLHPGPLPDDCYAASLPADIRQACTGVPVVDQAVRTLYATGVLHNHARMWLASYVVHVRKVHWRAGADWLYGHLLDGDLASNHLSWQWIAGTGSSKPYLFNADNVARHAPPAWHSPGTVIDAPYDRLEELARTPGAPACRGQGDAVAEPPCSGMAPADFGFTFPDPDAVAGRDVWVVHPWSLGEPPAGLPDDVRKVGVLVADFHSARPWSDRRWRFVGERMAALADVCWQGDAATLGAALGSARRVHGVADPHLAPWLEQLGVWQEPPALFPRVDRPCDSFSAWWRLATAGLTSATELLANREDASP